MEDSKENQKDLINYKLDQLQDSVNNINKWLKDPTEAGFIGRREFNALAERVSEKADKRELTNITKIVYGAVGLILIGFATVIINFFLRSPK